MKNEENVEFVTYLGNPLDGIKPDAPAPPSLHSSLIWFLFNPPIALFLTDAVLVLFVAFEDCELVVVGRSLLPLN